jgi:hypothetical protein
MRFKGSAALFALAALGVAATAVAAASGMVVRNGCTASQPIMAGNSVKATGGCYKNGTRIGTWFKRDYSQLDMAGNTCNTVTARSTVPSFKLPLAGSYSLEGSITATPVKASAGIRPFTRRFRIVTGHWQLRCGKAAAGADPGPASVCTANPSMLLGFDPTAFTEQNLRTGSIDTPCGQMVRDKEFNYTGPLPQVTGPPRVIGDRLFAGPVSPASGICTEDPWGPILKWSGQPIQAARWICKANGVTLAQWHVFYYVPPGPIDTRYCDARSTRVCLPPAAPQYVHYTAGPVDIPQGGLFSQLVLPADWNTWGGHLYVVELTEVRDMIDFHIFAHEFTTMEIKLSGSADASSELTSIPIVHGN